MHAKVNYIYRMKCQFAVYKKNNFSIKFQKTSIAYNSNTHFQHVIKYNNSALNSITQTQYAIKDNNTFQQFNITIYYCNLRSQSNNDMIPTYSP